MGRRVIVANVTQDGQDRLILHMLRRNIGSLSFHDAEMTRHTADAKALGPLTLEAKAAAILFTTNDEFFNGNRRSQDPLYQLQGHAIYDFGAGIWGSVDATWFGGGRTTLAGTAGVANLRISGPGAIVADHLVARQAAILNDGSGNVALTANGPVSIRSTGSGDVSVAGKPICTVENEGTGRIQCGTEGF